MSGEFTTIESNFAKMIEDRDLASGDTIAITINGSTINSITIPIEASNGARFRLTSIAVLK